MAGLLGATGCDLADRGAFGSKWKMSGVRWNFAQRSIDIY
jgi:hypothetical protein